MRKLLCLLGIHSAPIMIIDKMKLRSWTPEPGYLFGSMMYDVTERHYACPHCKTHINYTKGVKVSFSHLFGVIAIVCAILSLGKSGEEDVWVYLAAFCLGMMVIAKIFFEDKGYVLPKSQSGGYIKR